MNAQAELTRWGQSGASKPVVEPVRRWREARARGAEPWLVAAGEQRCFWRSPALRRSCSLGGARVRHSAPQHEDVIAPDPAFGERGRRRIRITIIGAEHPTVGGRFDVLPRPATMKSGNRSAIAMSRGAQTTSVPRGATSVTRRVSCPVPLVIDDGEMEMNAVRGWLRCGANYAGSSWRRRERARAHRRRDGPSRALRPASSWPAATRGGQRLPGSLSGARSRSAEGRSTRPARS